MFLDGAINSFFKTSEKRSLDSNASYLNEAFSLFASSPTSKASALNYRASLKLSAVYNAVDQISSDVAKIPFAIFQKDTDSRNRMASHPADILLALEPNKYMTTYIWKKTMMTSLLLRGNGLSIINPKANGEPSDLEFVNWDYVYDIRRKDNELLYFIKGYDKAFLSSEVIHIKNVTHNGIVGVSVITYAANQLNMAIEVQNFSATNFENKGVRSGVIETDKVVKEKNGIIQGWRSAMSERSADRVAVLDEGFKFKPINITPAEAQIVEMSRFTIEDIARWFNIPLHKIKSMQASTNNNIEQQSLDYSSDTIYPFVVNIEQEFAKKLLTDKEKKTNFYVRGNMAVLVRADLKSKSEFYSKAINWGWMNRQEVRQLEELNDGPLMLEEYLTPVNTFTEDQLKNNLNQQNNG